MKAFNFRLAQILRWRKQGVLLEEARLAACAARIAEIGMARQDLDARLAAASRAVAAGNSLAVEGYEGFLKLCRRQRGILDGQDAAAKKEHAQAMTRLLEATRKVRLLQNLRDEAHLAWQRDCERDLADFAGEAFLARHSALSRAELGEQEYLRSPAETLISGHRNGTIEKRTGA